jgi:hypothetical protein
MVFSFACFKGERPMRFGKFFAIIAAAGAILLSVARLEGA